MADNYTALKSSQKKRYISKETFNSLDLSQIPVGSEYEVVNPIEKGDLSADINNALNKAEKSIPEPTNQTTGSDGDVLVKKGGGSEWKSMPVPTVVQGTGQSTTDVMSQKAVTDELTQRPIVTANPGAGTETLSTIKIGETAYTVASGGDPYTLPVATADKLGGVKSSTTGTTANRDYNVEVKTDGTMKVNVPWTDTVTDTSKFAKLDEKNTFKDTQSVIVPSYPYDGTDITHDGPVVYRDRQSNYYTAYGLLSIYRHDLIEAVIQLPEANGTLALTSDVDAKSSFSVEVW